MTEEELEGVWIIDPVRQTRQASLDWHFEKHGAEVEAQDAEQYLRKAVAFAQERRGRGYPVSGPTPDVKRWKKSGKYIDVAPNSEIASFGKSV